MNENVLAAIVFLVVFGVIFIGGILDGLRECEEEGC